MSELTPVTRNEGRHRLERHLDRAARLGPGPFYAAAVGMTRGQLRMVGVAIVRADYSVARHAVRHALATGEIVDEYDPGALGPDPGDVGELYLTAGQALYALAEQVGDHLLARRWRDALDLVSTANDVCRHLDRAVVRGMACVPDRATTHV